MGLASVSNKMNAHQPSAANTRLQGRWLAVAWTGWSILTLLSLIDFITSIHEYLVDIQTLCRPGSCVAGQPTLETAQTLHRFGLLVDAYAGLVVGLVIIAGLISCAVATIIIWRKPRDWMALLVTSTLITQGLVENNFLQGFFDNPASPWHVVGLLFSYLSPVQVLFFCAFFPTGRSVPRWTGWLLVGISLVDLPANLFPSIPLGGPIEAVFVLSGFPLVVGSMVYRYRRVSTPVERQQTKWVVFGVTLVLFAFLGWVVPQIILFSSLSQPGSLYDLIGHPFLTVSEIIVPICLGIAVLRSHLWDIDVIINKALVYGTLTAILALLYAGMVLGLQALLGGLLHQTNTIALIVSTLAIAALFQPARTRIQTMIDRRFYRQKYDAQKTLAAFSATLRNEVDLATLSAHLLAVVQETMQPTYASLWLRQAEQAQTGSRQVEFSPLSPVMETRPTGVQPTAEESASSEEK